MGTRSTRVKSRSQIQQFAAKNTLATESLGSESHLREWGRKGLPACRIGGVPLKRA
jgi:hypothetical protein